MVRWKGPDVRCLSYWGTRRTLLRHKVGSLYTVRVIVAPRDAEDFGVFVAFVSNAAASGGEQNKNAHIAHALATAIDIGQP